MAVVMAVGSPGQRTQHRSHEGRGSARGRGVWGKLPGSRGPSRGATRDARRSHQRLLELLTLQSRHHWRLNTSTALTRVFWMSHDTTESCLENGVIF